MSVCNKCSKQIKPSDLKTCSKCCVTYHYQCLGVPVENFSKESKAYKATWKCPECKLTEKRGESSHTPSRLKNTGLNIETPAAQSIEELKDFFNKKLNESLSKLLSDIRRDFSAESADTRGKIEELTESVNFMSAKYDQLKEELDSKTKKIEDLEIENKSLKLNIADISGRLNQFESDSAVSSKSSFR